MHSVAIGQANGRAIVASGSPEGLRDLGPERPRGRSHGHRARRRDHRPGVHGDQRGLGDHRRLQRRHSASRASPRPRRYSTRHRANGGGGRELDPARSGSVKEPASQPRRATGEHALAEALRETERETERPADEPDLNDGFRLPLALVGVGRPGGDTVAGTRDHRAAVRAYRRRPAAGGSRGASCAMRRPQSRSATPAVPRSHRTSESSCCSCSTGTATFACWKRP